MISTILRREVTYNQTQGICAEVKGQLKPSMMKNTIYKHNLIIKLQTYLSICFISLQYFKVANANCTTDSDCVQGEVDFDGHGTVFISDKIFLHAQLVCICLIFFNLL